MQRVEVFHQHLSLGRSALVMALLLVGFDLNAL